MSDCFSVYRGRFIVLGIFVCVVATLLSGVLGSLASLLYGGFFGYPEPSPEEIATSNLVHAVGGWGGLGAGLLAGVVWCQMMFRRVRRGQTKQLISSGSWLGVVVGILATVLLHAGLMVASARPDFFNLIVGLIFGIPAGAILGVICGAICQRIASSEVATPKAGEELEH